MAPYRIFLLRASEDTAQLLRTLDNRRDAMRWLAGYYLNVSTHYLNWRVFILDHDGNPLAELG